MLNTSVQGLLAIFAWCIISAVARIITGSTTQSIEPSVLCFYTFVIAMIVFIVLNVSSIKQTILQCKQENSRKTIVGLNITTFGAWFFLIYPLKYIDPAMTSTITLGLGPLATIILGFFIYKNYEFNYLDLLISISLLIIILLIIKMNFNGIAIRGNPNKFSLICAISSCFIVGFTTAAGNLFAKKLSDLAFKPTAVLIARFPLIILLSGIISIVSKNNLILTQQTLLQIIVVSSSLVILPLYLIQLSIKHLDPIVVAITAPLMPALVLIFEYIAHQNIYWGEAASVATTVLLISLSTVVRFRKKIKVTSR